MLNAETAEYADTLRAAGFTVYTPVKEDRHRGWFHYSRVVDGVTLYGTYNDGHDNFRGPEHTMPIKPSRLNGSSAIIGARWGDTDTLGLDTLDPRTVQYAELVTRPENWCPYNYPETRENLQLSNIGRSPGRSAVKGATLRNAEPWGIGTHYTAA